MQVSEIALLTVARARTMTTKIVNRLVARMLDIPFMARSRKLVYTALVVLLGVSAVGYVTYRAAATNANSTFLQNGANAVRDLAQKSRPFVLGEDVLALNVLIRDVRELDALTFAAIVDHQDKILSHTNNAMMNVKMRPLGQAQERESLDGIRVISGLTDKREPVVAFFQTIRYADVPIGQVVVGLDSRRLQTRIATMRWIYIAAIVMTLVGTCALIFGLDRSKQKKALETQAAMEKTNRIGPYLLKDKVAMGGMAELFLADYIREDGFKRKVAIKRIRPHLAENADFIKMFTREARLAALLQHPNIVQIFDYGKIDNAYFIAMEYIDGKNLGEILATTKIGLPVDQTVFLMSEICKGLDYSHRRLDDETGEPLHIVHRDLSPQNMLISSTGEVKNSDFGISKARSEPSYTQAGVIKGKLAYMSPEQALGQAVDQRADIYALGLVFHETLTGIRVYRFDNEVEAIRSIPKREIEPLTQILNNCPKELNRIVMKCLAKERDARYQNADDVYRDLVDLKKSMNIVFDTADLAAFMRQGFMDSDNKVGTT